MNNALISQAFGVCAKCGKRQVFYGPRGGVIFIFGDFVGGDNDTPPTPLVQMWVKGIVRMQCTRKSCRRKFPEHWNTYRWRTTNKLTWPAKSGGFKALRGPAPDSSVLELSGVSTESAQ